MILSYDWIQVAAEVNKLADERLVSEKRNLFVVKIIEYSTKPLQNNRQKWNLPTLDYLFHLRRLSGERSARHTPYSTI